MDRFELNEKFFWLFVKNHEFIDYVLPLIQGEPELPLECSLPRYARLKKVLAK